jgi:hypothetical protein
MNNINMTNKERAPRAHVFPLSVELNKRMLNYSTYTSTQTHHYYLV